MRRIFFLFLFVLSHLFAADFDVIIVGTSPICLLEALYRCQIGNRVLILEGASECGGAWKSVDICGIPHADLGCHYMGNDKQMREFLENYLRCNMVSLNNPRLPYDQASSNLGYYPAGGCYELMQNLMAKVHASNITLMQNLRLTSIYLDTERMTAIAKTGEQEFTASKILLTPYTEVQIENYPEPSSYQSKKTKFTHLYLLIEDPYPFRFTYHNGVSSQMSRMMNLTYFVGLDETGLQLIVIQLRKENNTVSGNDCLRQLQERGLISGIAKLLQAESYTYEQRQCNHSLLQKIKAGSPMLEVLETGSIGAMTTYIPKWKQVLN